MRKTAVPRESVASMALSNTLADGLVLGATSVEIFELEELSAEQPTRAKLVAITVDMATAVIRM